MVWVALLLKKKKWVATIWLVMKTILLFVSSVSAWALCDWMCKFPVLLFSQHAWGKSIILCLMVCLCAHNRPFRSANRMLKILSIIILKSFKIGNLSINTILYLISFLWMQNLSLQYLQCALAVSMLYLGNISWNH